jgi:hypothetical protein
VRRAVWLVVLLVAGCGGPDLAKTTYPRTVVPAAPGDAARLSAQGLRLVDPCELLDTDLLARYGTPDVTVAQGYDSCRNYMETESGASLSFTVRVGESTTSGTLERATARVAGFAAEESTVDGACFVTLVVTEPDPDLAVELQVGLEDGDACPVAREVAAGVGQRLRAGATLRTPEPGSLLPVDPCAVAGSPAADALPGAGSPEPYGLHQCSWSAGASEIELSFVLRHDPAVDPDEGSTAVDLGGGVGAVQLERSDTFPSCRLAWLHRAAPAPSSPSSPDGTGDVVTVEVRDVGRTGLDVCGTARTVATALAPTLPR